MNTIIENLQKHRIGGNIYIYIYIYIQSYSMKLLGIIRHFFYVVSNYHLCVGFKLYSVELV